MCVYPKTNAKLDLVDVPPLLEKRTDVNICSHLLANLKVFKEDKRIRHAHTRTHSYPVVFHKQNNHAV